MKTFEMPKMNVAIFSLEDVITTSIVEPTTSNLELAKNALIDAGVADTNVTVSTAAEWVNAPN